MLLISLLPPDVFIALSDRANWMAELTFSCAPSHVYDQRSRPWRVASYYQSTPLQYIRDGSMLICKENQLKGATFLQLVG